MNLGPNPNQSWGDPIATWDYSSGVAAVDFTGLGDYRDLMLVFYGITQGGGSEALLMRLSTDNGSTFISAASSYTNVGSVLTTSLPVSASFAAATAIMGEVSIWDFNAASYRTKSRNASGQEASGTTATSRLGMRAAAERNDALRLLWSGGANFTAGSIRLYGRRG